MRKVMLRPTAARYLWLPALALAVGLVAAFSSGGHVVAQEGGGFAADCEGNSLQIDSDCDFGSGQEFTVAVHIASAPAQGYGLFQAKLRWDEDVLEYRATEGPGEEVVWPDCSIPARTDNTAGLPDRVQEPTVLFGCVPFPLLTEPSSYEGPIFLYTFACVGDGTSSLTLVPKDGDPQQGSHFLDLIGNPIESGPALAEASVTCGGAEQERPPVEIEPNPPGDLATPTPNGEDPTPAETDGTPVASPAAPDTTPTRTISNGDDDDDDDGLPAWAWVLIGLGIIVGVGGVAFAVWRQMNQEDAGASGADASEADAPDTDQDA